MFELLAWVMNGVAIIGAKETSQTRVNLLKVNSLYFVANLYSVLYFLVTEQWPYFFLYCAFLFFAIRGIGVNLKPKLEVLKWRVWR